MKNVSNNSKVISEVEKKLSELDKNISIILELNNKNPSAILKKQNSVAKDIESLYKILFDEKHFNEDLFDYFNERKIFQILAHKT